MSKGISTGGFSQIPTTVTLSGDTIDWAQGNVFSRQLSANAIVSFLNHTDGRTIVVTMTNTTASNLTLTWPAAVVNPETSLPANTTTVFTLINVQGDIYLAAAEY